ncbi:GDP/GTP exchange factor Sec2p [Dictyocaulus viviparus]|uniref:GDP/GTP exchange factor Sec2p n=1 Tax=Dictyocaulus viviparus TaxID=29172 RepID=A0A0D8XCG1_DICVI|nr:GDP/GTP exchange factor Sec2p [Dictyocaulus viviparus]
MTETLSITSLTVMCEGKDQPEFSIEVPPSCFSNGDEILRMRQELEAARRSLVEKDEKMCRMSRIQDSVDAEVQELTEKLFQEAYRMVNYAEERRERAERLMNEFKLQVEVLTAEVAALKLLVQTPGMGQNHFQHTSPEHKSALAKLFSTSSAKRSSSSGATQSRKSYTLPSLNTQMVHEIEKDNEQKLADAVEEIDPILMSEFTSWREAGHPLVHHPFMERVNSEEVEPCMLFHAKELSDAILDSIAANKLELEPVNEDKPSVMLCALTNISRFCPYRVRVAEGSEWHRISLLARNRIAAVCDYYTFIRYLRVGLIKSGIRDAYFDVMTLRKNMCLAKLGLGFVPKTNLHHGF